MQERASLLVWRCTFFALAVDRVRRITFTGGASAVFSYAFNKNHELIARKVNDAAFNWNPAANDTTIYNSPPANSLNQYTKVDGIDLTYNTNGCLTGDGTWTYGYELENHLLTATKSGTSATMVYDPMHRQSQKSVTTGSTVKTRYIYSGWQRIADYNGATGALENRYVYGTSLDEPLIRVTSGGAKTYFMH